MLEFTEVIMFIDVHAHLDDKKFENLDMVIEQAKKMEVEKIITSGSNIQSSLNATNIAKKYENVFASVGVHPEEQDIFRCDFCNELFDIVKSNNKIVAIGEIGLDYHTTCKYRKEQIDAFLGQIYLAEKLNLPIIIHSREAMKDTIDILKQYKSHIKHIHLHCFGGSKESAIELLNLDATFSFGGICTFKNAKKCIETISALPLKNIMLETDCPYLAPHPYRGEINSPKFIPIIAQKIAEIKNLAIEEIAKITTMNAERIFNI